MEKSIYKTRRKYTKEFVETKVQTESHVDHKDIIINELEEEVKALKLVLYKEIGKGSKVIVNACLGEEHLGLS